MFVLVAPGQIALQRTPRLAYIHAVFRVSPTRACFDVVYAAPAAPPRIFGNVTLEAMACGLAIVAADVPSTNNLAVDGVSALISPPSASDYAGRVRRLLMDPSLRSTLSRGARSAALQWSWEQVLDTVVGNYRVVLDRYDAGANRKMIR